MVIVIICFLCVYAPSQLPCSALFFHFFFFPPNVNTNYTLSPATHKRAKNTARKKSICINSRQNFSHFLALDEVVAGGELAGMSFQGASAREGSLSFHIDIAGCCPLVVVFIPKKVFIVDMDGPGDGVAWVAQLNFSALFFFF